jgi:hypothetical protein
MRSLILALSTILVFFNLHSSLTAQSPNKISYQSVVRNASGSLVGNSLIGTRVTILQGTENGQVVYSETHTAQTNSNGLLSMKIGGGTAQTGNFDSINWSNGPYFIRLEHDLNGGNNYTITATSELQSVPYAIHSNEAISVSKGNHTFFNHYIGEVFGGGVVFHLWKDGLGEEHGLILYPNLLSTAATWGNSGLDLPNCESVWDGLANTNVILNSGAVSTDAASLCAGLLSVDGYDDWYLPALSEMDLLYSKIFDINRVLSTIPGASQFGYNIYWTSTESDAFDAWHFGYYDGFTTFLSMINSSKNNPFAVVAVRKF